MIGIVDSVTIHLLPLMFFLGQWGASLQTIHSAIIYKDVRVNTE